MVLNTIGKAATRVLNLRERLLNVLDTALETLETDAGIIFLLEPDGETLVIRASRGVSDEFLETMGRIKVWEGISGIAIGEKRPVAVERCPDPHLAGLIDREGFKTVAAAPLSCEGDAIGSLILMARRPHDFPADELKTLDSIGQLLGQAIRNSLLHEKIRQELVLRTDAENAHREAEERIKKALAIETALRMIDASIIAGDNVGRTLQLICDAIVEMGYRMCWIGLSEPDHTVRPVAYRGFEEGYLERIRIRWDDTPEGRGPSGMSIRTGRPFACEDIQIDDRFLPWREEALKRGYRSSVAIPLATEKNEVIGCFNVYSESGRTFPPEEIHRLETFAQQCTVAILNARRLEALRDANQRLTFHVNRMPLAYIAWDKDFRVVKWNPAAERIFGWKAHEASGKHSYELVVPAEAQPHVERVWAKLLEGDESSYSLNANICKDGKKITCEWFNTSLRDGSGNVIGVLSMVHDITEKTNLERQLQTAQKMEAVGTLAGGIAHDFNNALTGIFGFAELLKQQFAGNERALAGLSEILRCAERASTLTRQLLTYSRRQIIEPVNLSLNKVIADLMKLVEKVTGERIEIRTFLEKNLRTIRADVGQIEQVIMNLVLNARDAMPDGGQLLIETGLANLDAEYVRYHPYMSIGSYVVLTVSDTGVGMDAKTQERVFDPFFTTKGPDKGTGLGLAMVYGIVKQHKGFIHLYSEPGKGTTLKIYFPPVEAVPDMIESRKSSEIRGGTETILLAEDDESVRMLVDRTLTELGYTVLVARNGEDALEVFHENREKISLALLDVVMPVKGGKEAYEAMHRERPGLKVIFMSGYSANSIHESFILIAGVPFLGKPFGPEALAKKVREILDRD